MRSRLRSAGQDAVSVRGTRRVPKDPLFYFFSVPFQFGQPGPTREKKADQLQRSFCGRSTGVQQDLVACDDRTVNLKNHPVLLSAQQVSATEPALEQPKEQLDFASASDRFRLSTQPEHPSGQ